MPYPQIVTLLAARRRALLFASSALLLAAASATVFGADLSVSSAAELTTALGRARPGDRIVMNDGVWRDQYLRFEGTGRNGAPIVLTAKNPGRTILTGSSHLDISGEWLEVNGLVFKDGALPEGQHVVRFMGSKGVARNSRFTNSAIINYNPPNPATRYMWVSIYGSDNRVDNNVFEGQRHSGPTVVVQRKPGVADRHVIERNYFKGRPTGKGNGFESIRIGAGPGSDTDSSTVVQENLFEGTDGELEIISVKAGDNLIRANTFRHSKGTITLRQGNNNRVIGNFFLGEGVSETGGIRVMGEGHVISDNHFDGITGRLGGAIVFHCGETARSETQVPVVRHVTVAKNTLSNVQGPAFRLDAGCDTKPGAIRPNDVEVTDNKVSGGSTELAQGQSGPGWRWERNDFGGRAAPSNLPPGLKDKVPATTKAKKVQRPVAGSAASVPLTASDVGPSWMRQSR